MSTITIESSVPGVTYGLGIVSTRADLTREQLNTIGEELNGIAAGNQWAKADWINMLVTATPEKYVPTVFKAVAKKLNLTCRSAQQMRNTARVFPFRLRRADIAWCVYCLTARTTGVEFLCDEDKMRAVRQHVKKHTMGRNTLCSGGAIIPNDMLLTPENDLQYVSSYVRRKNGRYSSTAPQYKQDLIGAKPEFLIAHCKRLVNEFKTVDWKKASDDDLAIIRKYEEQYFAPKLEEIVMECLRRGLFGKA